MNWPPFITLLFLVLAIGSLAEGVADRIIGNGGFLLSQWAHMVVAIVCALIAGYACSKIKFSRTD